MNRTALLALALGVSPISVTTILAQETPVVVELFTSQGCSSCPPADVFLTDLAHERRDILPLAFHVTYWNGLGWKDPFSFEAATERQRRYAVSLGDGQVYTPEIVVNGASGFVGSDRAKGLAEISRAARSPKTHISLHLARVGETLIVSVGAGVERGTILLVGFDPEHRTPIGRGENSGRMLLESNIVRSLKSAGQWTGTSIELCEPLPLGERFAVLLQADDGRILSAAALEQAFNGG